MGRRPRAFFRHTQRLATAIRWPESILCHQSYDSKRNENPIHVFWQKSDCKLFFDSQEITQAEHYKYVGNIIKPVHACHGDIFDDNYNFLCVKAQKSYLQWKRTLKLLVTCRHVSCFLCSIQPILLYGSEIWGVRKIGCTAIDRVFFSFMKHTLYVKQSTSNIITIEIVNKPHQV